MEATENKLGYPLPPLLRRIYTEVANGGIGPALYGLNALEELYSGAGYPEVESPWPGVTIALIQPAEPRPDDADKDDEPEYDEVDRVAIASQIFVADGGCQDHYFCDAAHPNFPVILQEELVAWPIAAQGETNHLEILAYFGDGVAPGFDAWIEDWLRKNESTVIPF